jgi:hypothetical protein
MELTDPVKRILSNYESDNPGTKANLARILLQGSLDGTGRLLILPVERGSSTTRRAALHQIRRPTKSSRSTRPRTGSVVSLRAQRSDLERQNAAGSGLLRRFALRNDVNGLK